MDGGPQFHSSEFQVFLEQNNIHGFPVANYNPCENGLVERWNETLKGGIQASRSASTPWDERMMTLLSQHWDMPSSPIGPSPAALSLAYEVCILPSKNTAAQVPEEGSKPLSMGEDC